MAYYPWTVSVPYLDRLPAAQLAKEIEDAARAFANWDGATGDWVVDPGEYTIFVGDSSANLPLRASVSPTPGRVD